LWDRGQTCRQYYLRVFGEYVRESLHKSYAMPTNCSSQNGTNRTFCTCIGTFCFESSNPWASKGNMRCVYLSRIHWYFSTQLTPNHAPGLMSVSLGYPCTRSITPNTTNRTKSPTKVTTQRLLRITAPARAITTTSAKATALRTSTSVAYRTTEERAVTTTVPAAPTGAQTVNTAARAVTTEARAVTTMVRAASTVARSVTTEARAVTSEAHQITWAPRAVTMAASDKSITSQIRHHRVNSSAPATY